MSHTTGAQWNEWSLDPSADDDGYANRGDALHLEDHWNAGGAEPAYRHANVVQAEEEDVTGSDDDARRIVYRLGETLVNQDELEAFRAWKQTHLGQAPGAERDEDDLTRKEEEELSSSSSSDRASAWASNAAVQGGVIMPKLGNATAKYVPIKPTLP
ncbi:hypothetical protein QFC19_007661 [Naganishia cerealis]|uniref:Uncharacterized protein n=1 Tax=Naganishia cerealis TaxID=610337 RepID=A0ACC2V8L1_9TREE|nr:hypothetical protein QFC19_007661 [Naganishia cerealis]